jgi:hypothetical protein
MGTRAQVFVHTCKMCETHNIKIRINFDGIPHLTKIFDFL